MFDKLYLINYTKNSGLSKMIAEFENNKNSIIRVSYLI